MRIILPTLTLVRSGGSRVLMAAANLLAAASHEVELVIASRGALPYPIDERVRVTALNLDYNRSTFHFCRALLAIKRRLARADLVLVNFFPLLYPALLARASVGPLDIVYWLQSDDAYLSGRLLSGNRFRRTVKSCLARWSYALPVRRLAVSQWLADRLHKCYGSRAGVLSPGIDAELFKPAQSAVAQPGLIGCMGWKEPFKGLPLILAAFRILSGVDANVRLRVFTVDPELQLSDERVEVVSARSDLELVTGLQQCSVFLHASSFEGFGLPPLEAMACRTPVVAVNSGGSSDYLLEGINCLLPARNPRAIADAVNSVLNAESLRARLCDNGWQTAQEYSLAKRGPLMVRTLLGTA